MNKPIAELIDKKRELEEKLTKLLDIAIPSSEEDFDLEQLEKQSQKTELPKKERMYSLAEVEQIAREAFIEGQQGCDYLNFEDMWTNKKAELSK